MPLIVAQVTAHFSPVLHHFFLETFRQPADWFERRLQYTRSVAVNSMAGTPTSPHTYTCKTRLPSLTRCAEQCMNQPVS